VAATLEAETAAEEWVAEDPIPCILLVHIFFKPKVSLHSTALEITEIHLRG
jgi:hypothetical protein